jgi:hypothetical protein
MSLSGITENILNKAMLEAYGSVESVVSDIATRPTPTTSSSSSATA